MPRRAHFYTGYPMDYSQFEQFYYVRQGDEWVMPRPRFLTGLSYVAGTLLTGFGVSLCWVGMMAEPTRDDRGGLLFMGLLMLAGGITFLLYGVRFRQSFDVQQQAFIMQAAYTRTTLPTRDITEVRPVELTVNGIYQGLHYEAFSAKKPAKTGARGLKISPSFKDQAQSERFRTLLSELLHA